MTRITDELERIHRLLDSGALTLAEYEQAKAEILAEPSDLDRSNSIMLEARMLKLEADNALLRVDQNWEMERRKYLIRSSMGAYEPTREAAFISWFGSTIFVVMGLFILWTRVSVGGILAVTVGVGWGIYVYNKVIEFEAAQAAYRQMRSDLRSSYETRIRNLRL
jgi:hypothetical protein